MMNTKTPRKLFLLGAFVICLFIPASHVLSETQPSLSELLDAYQVPATSSFTQARHLAALDQPLMSSGSLNFIEGEQLEWNIEQPFSTQYTYNGKALEQTEFGETKTIRLQDDPMLVGFFSFFYELLNGDTKALEELFDASFESQSDAGYTITLLPKQSFLKSSFQSVVIQLEKKHIARVDIIESEKDKVILSFSS